MCKNTKPAGFYTAVTSWQGHFLTAAHLIAVVQVLGNSRILSYIRRMQLTTTCSDFQHTLRSETRISGVGIHTGQTVEITLKPAEANTGIVFKRTDLPNAPTVKADVDNVVETTRSTTIEANGARVGTIEHLMAALVGNKVDNVVIEINAPEVPILDGKWR